MRANRKLGLLLYPCKSVLVIVDVGLQGFWEPEWHLSDYRKELTK